MRNEDVIELFEMVNRGYAGCNRGVDFETQSTVELVILSGAKGWRFWIESPANTSKKT